MRMVIPWEVEEVLVSDGEKRPHTLFLLGLNDWIYVNQHAVMVVMGADFAA